MGLRCGFNGIHQQTTTTPDARVSQSETSRSSIYSRPRVRSEPSSGQLGSSRRCRSPWRLERGSLARFGAPLTASDNEALEWRTRGHPRKVGTRLWVVLPPSGSFA